MAAGGIERAAAVDASSRPRDRFVGTSRSVQRSGDFEDVAGQQRSAAVNLYERVGISGAECPADHCLAHGEVGPVPFGRGFDLFPARFEQAPVFGESCFAENAGIVRGRSVEPVKLRFQFELDQPARQLDRIDTSLTARTHMEFGEPLDHASEMTVIIVDVVDRLVGPPEGMLGKAGDCVGVAQVAETLEVLDHDVNAVCPSLSLAIADEVAVGSERALDAAHPHTQLDLTAAAHIASGRCSPCGL